MKFGELTAHLNSALNGDAKFAAAYLLVGGDGFLRSEAKRLLKSVLLEDFASFNFSTVQTADEAVDALMTVPVFDEHRICVLSPDKEPGEQDVATLAAYLASPVHGSILVLDGSDATAKKVGTKACQKVDCGALSEEELHAQIAKLLAAPPAAEMDARAEEELVRRTQGSMARIASEIEKLKAYSYGKILPGDVRLLVGADLDYQAYLLADAVSKKNANDALTILSYLIDEGFAPWTILSSLYDRYRKLLHISLNKNLTNDALAELLGVKSGAIYFMRKEVDGYTQIRLKRCVDRLHALQYDIVSGKRSDESAMHQAVLELLNI